MARIDLPPGEDRENVRVWRVRPELGEPATALSRAVYRKSILPARVRECARMRIAQINDCPI